MDCPPEPARVVPAVAAHVEALAPRLREADRREIRAAFGRPAEAILKAGFRNAKRCWTVLAGARPIAMFGVGRRSHPRIGTAWLLASEDFERYGRQLRREGPYWVDALMVGHDVLTNFVPDENRVAVRWLSWLGFELLVLHRGVGTGGEDFWEFAAFRAGTRERWLAREPGAPSAESADSPRGEGGAESEPEPGPRLGKGARGPRPGTA